MEKARAVQEYKIGENLGQNTNLNVIIARVTRRQVNGFRANGFLKFTELMNYK